MDLPSIFKKILRLPQVIERTGLCRTSIYYQIGAGTFPKQVKIGLRAVGWHEESIDKWIRERAS
jgi:prophage regulatory protein